MRWYRETARAEMRRIGKHTGHRIIAAAAAGLKLTVNTDRISLRDEPQNRLTITVPGRGEITAPALLLTTTGRRVWR